MKVAVSIPDALFADADSLAKQLNTSRSDVYARALGEFIGHHAPDRVTAAMNQVVAAVGDSADPFIRAAAVAVLKRVEW